MGARKLRKATQSVVVPAEGGLAPFSSDPKTGLRLGEVGARAFEGQHGCSPTVHPVESGVGAGGELANWRRRSSSLKGEGMGRAASARFGGRGRGLGLIHVALRSAERFTSVFRCLVSASWTWERPRCEYFFQHPRWFSFAAGLRISVVFGPQRRLLLT